MGDSKTKAKKPSKIKGLKAEFKKIYLARQKDSWKANGGSRLCYCNLGSDYLGSRRASNIRNRFLSSIRK